MGVSLCEHCQAELPRSTRRRRFCTTKCRAAAWQHARKDRETRLRELAKAFAKETGLTAQDFA